MSIKRSHQNKMFVGQILGFQNITCLLALEICQDVCMQRLHDFLRGGTMLCFMKLSTAQSPNYLLAHLLLTCGMASEYPVDFAASLL